MPTIVDTLALELSLDPKKLEQGLTSVVEKVRKTRDDYERNAKAFEAVAAGLLRVLTPLASAIIGITSAIEAIDWSKHASAATTEFSNLANVIGMNIEQLSAWRQAAEEAGKGGGDALVQSFARQQQTMLSMMKGGTGLKDPGFLAALQHYGITADMSKYLDEKGNLDMNKFNLDLAAAAQKLNESPAQRALWMQKLYISHPAQLSLYENRADLEEKLKKQKEKVGVVNKDNADAMKKLYADWTNLGAAAENLKMQIVTGLIHPLSEGLEFLQKILKELKDWMADPNNKTWLNPRWWEEHSQNTPAPNWWPQFLQDWYNNREGFTNTPTAPSGSVRPSSKDTTSAPSSSRKPSSTGTGVTTPVTPPSTPAPITPPPSGIPSTAPPTTAPSSPSTGGRKLIDLLPPDYKPNPFVPGPTEGPASIVPPSERTAPSSGGSSTTGNGGAILPVPSPHSFLDDRGLFNLPKAASVFSQRNNFASNQPTVNTNSNITIGAMSFHATTNDSMLGYAPSGNERTLAVGEYSVHANTSLI